MSEDAQYDMIMHECRGGKGIICSQKGNTMRSCVIQNMDILTM